MAWKGIVGRGFTAEEFDRYVRTVTFPAWRPRFVVVHNTQVPTFREWHGVAPERRMRGFVAYYRDEQRWSGGPHLFVADDRIWVFTPLNVPGVHSPSWNGSSLGVEIVGDYDREPMSPAVWSNCVQALATLHTVLGLDPDTLRLHKEDPRTTHTFCPGRAVDRATLIADIRAEMASDAGEHLPARGLAFRPAPAEEVPVAAGDADDIEPGGGG
ncbi:MAG TPA: peptidoglycan recognition family protein [Longimicrobiales bacterium]|nr:peptidoglycan recognition family protein [Longimicrobiales bacterium]